MTESTALPLFCDHCRGAIAVEIVEWNRGQPPVPASFYCPHCDKQNRLAAPGRLARVEKRAVDVDPPVV
jgi:hypothetical protein